MSLPEDFDWEYYLDSNIDLKKNGIKSKSSAEHHYIMYGVKENRKYKKTTPLLPEDFDWEYYLESHDDLKRQLNKNKTWAEQHYIINGIKEGRSYKKPTNINTSEIIINEIEELSNINKLTIFDTEESSEMTIALPIYNSKKIAWLSLESLSNQVNINFKWELIIYEEEHDESVCPNLLNEYLNKLKKVNCCRIILITNTERVLLIDKWIEIGKSSNENSKVFMLHAADCYSPSNRLKITYDKIVNENYDWYDQTKGFFYSFISDRVILYNYSGLTNLNMSLKTKYIKTLPKSNLKKGIDGYIYKHCKSLNPDLKHYYDPILYHDSVDTHGFNNISLSREEFFDTKPQIFITTNLTLNNLGFNPYTKFKIKKMKDLLETNKLLLIQLNPLFFITHLLKKIKTHRWFITFKWKIFNS